MPHFGIKLFGSTFNLPTGVLTSACPLQMINHADMAWPEDAVYMVCIHADVILIHIDMSKDEKKDKRKSPQEIV